MDLLILLRFPHVGKELIKLYYQWSPVIVKAMEADEEFKEDVKALVDGILGMVEPAQCRILPILIMALNSITQ